jgi:exonuclease SbcC
LEIEKAGVEAEKRRQLSDMTICDELLNQEVSIKENCDIYRGLEEKEKQLIESKTLYVTKKQALAQNEAEVSKIETDLAKAEADKKAEEEKLQTLSDNSEDEIIKAKAEEYDKKITLYDELRSLQIKYESKKSELTGAESKLFSVVQERLAAIKAVEQKKEELERKTELLKSSGCVDVENANCKFLQDAKAAEVQLKSIPDRIEAVNNSYNDTIKSWEQTIKEQESQIESLGYSQEAMDIVKNELVGLKLYKDKADELQKKEVEISAIKAGLEVKGMNISNLTERLATVKLQGTELTSEVEQYASAYEESIKIQAQMSQLRPWLEKEQQLPVMKERKGNILKRYSELDVQIVEINNEIEEKKAEYATEIGKTVGIEEKKAEVEALNNRIDSENEIITEIQTKIGALKQKIEDMAIKAKQIEELRKIVDKYSKENADYEILKKSFSQDGIPHQIILSILPTLTETANTILGQMTGGKMGVDFQTEKVNTQKKEKVALDVLINEYGKGTLPYLSKSGGEKVKASLAVILALAEIKSSTAGMQLGMLFIDEPPFLDTDGVQAYCDALVTIQRRYPDLKVMAITHDPTMKARFPQNLDVIKTEEGSKIKYI